MIWTGLPKDSSLLRFRVQPPKNSEVEACLEDDVVFTLADSPGGGGGEGTAALCHYPLYSQGALQSQNGCAPLHQDNLCFALVLYTPKQGKQGGGEWAGKGGKGKQDGWEG